MLRWGSNIGEFLRQVDESDFRSLPISIVGIKVIAEGLNFRLSLEKFLRCHSDNVFLQELLLSVLSFPDLSCLSKLPFLFSDEHRHNVTLSRSEAQIWHWSIGVLVPEIDEIKDLLWIHK